jgi:Tfp pilus assembly protein PilN
MKLQLNLATAPQENHRPFVVGALLTGLLGVLVFVLLAHAAYQSWRASRDLRADISRLESQIQVDRQRRQDLSNYFHSPAAQNIFDRSAFLNSLIDGRSFPWTKIFTDLEETLPPGVRVVSIAPKLVNGRAEVTLQVGADSDESKIKFLEAMEKSSVFSGMIVNDEKPAEQSGAAERLSNAERISDKVLLDLTVWYSTT